jgi:HlyD family secretion protein
MGASLARLDTASLEAHLRQAEAELRRAERERDYALAIVAQRKSELGYAEREAKRLLELKESNYAAEEQVDKARTTVRTAEAARRAARVKVAETEAAIEAAAAAIESIAADISDSALKAPRRGRVLYRLAEPGEVLGAGGKVLTLLDLTDLYMVFFLPGGEAGRVAIGAEARLVLDAAPDYVIPARISFVAARAQFTPKQVETRSEREKLVFRAKARIAPALLERYEPLVKTGLPGSVYVSLDPAESWPEWLTPRLPPWPRRKNDLPD